MFTGYKGIKKMIKKKKRDQVKIIIQFEIIIIIKFLFNKNLKSHVTF
jgi:hypothetical protein